MYSLWSQTYQYHPSIIATVRQSPSILRKIMRPEPNELVEADQGSTGEGASSCDSSSSSSSSSPHASSIDEWIKRMDQKEGGGATSSTDLSVTDDDEDESSWTSSRSTASILSSAQSDDEQSYLHANDDLESVDLEDPAVLCESDLSSDDVRLQCAQDSSPALDSHPDILVRIRQTMATKADQTYATWYDSSGKTVRSYTFQQLWDEASLIAYHLTNKWKIQPRQRVVLCYNFGLHFFAAFLACLRTNVTAVLVYPPGRPLVKSLTKMTKVINDCAPALILTDSDVMLLKKADTLLPGSKSRNLWPKDVIYKVTNKLQAPSTGLWHKKAQHIEFQDLPALPDDLAFLQYTSGSTGDPKGVMVTRTALGANIKLIYDGFARIYGDKTDDLVGFSWLPQYHDMGLIVGAICPFAVGWQMHMMSPITFVQNPVLWVNLMSEHKVIWSVAPDFAYNLVVRKFREAELRGQAPVLDLSCIGHLITSSEPVRRTSVENFHSTFCKYGLRQNSVFPAYGLAEHVVAACVAHGLVLSEPTVDGEEPLVASGCRSYFDYGVVVKIVDPQTFCEVSDGKTGEIWLAGPSVTAGYFGRSELTKEIFQATMVDYPRQRCHLRTGDLGYFEKDYLFICGRIKDLIICNGVNYYPQDIEFITQEASPGVRPGCVAAFSSHDAGGDGSLEIVFEIRRSHESKAMNVCQQVRSEVIQKVGLVPSRIVAISERTIKKTTSGKIQRRGTRAALHGDELVLVLDVSGSDPASVAFLDTKQSEDTRNQDDSGTESSRIDSAFAKFLGHAFDQTKTWEELGMSSLVSVEFRNIVADLFSVTLPPDCFEAYTTPQALKSFILQSRGMPFATKLPELQKIPNFSWGALGIVQVPLIALLFLLFAVNIIPAYHLTNWTLSQSGRKVVDINGRFIEWLWFPLAIPTFMVGFSICAIVVKWIIIGRYHECEVSCPSLAYVRWWFIDRVVHAWEFWVGRFVQDTPLLWLFYSLMGAKIHPSAKLDAFIREFDLVTIMRGASIEHQVRCRVFGPWKGEQGPSIRFRPIVVSKECVIRGMLLPGASVGECAAVARRSVVPEGAIVSPGVIAKGNPSFCAGRALGQSSPCWWAVGALKILWISFALYLFFAATLCAQIVMNDRLPPEWRYTPLLYWISIVAIASLVLLATSICLKWCLIGRRKQGRYGDSVLRSAADWIADYQFRASTFLLLCVSSGSRLWNFVLLLLGADVDYETKFFGDCFSPSNADLVSIRSSFLSTVTSDFKDRGSYKRLNLRDSSVGIGVHFDPGVNVERALIPPNTYVQESVVRKEPDNRHSHLSRLAVLRYEVILGILYTGLIVMIFLSLIPSFELWANAFKPSSVEMAVPVFAIVLALQSLVWVFMQSLFNLVAYGCMARRERTTPWFVQLWEMQMTSNWSLQHYSFLPMLWGTPFFGLVLRMLGSTVKGRVLYFGLTIHDPALNIFEDRTVVDDSKLSGHHGIFWDVTLGVNRVPYLVHPGGWVSMCEAYLKEAKPWRSITGSTLDTCVNDKDETQSIDSEDDISYWC